ncbi:hypothetical protein CC2G_004029 [Coprinopsis cinerea AmutBmut pab1-1]|nr:hypothetical protein CC2G_004029 [Coprinopsis cinerea AmutBmut pab1-1]
MQLLLKVLSFRLLNFELSSYKARQLWMTESTRAWKLSMLNFGTPAFTNSLRESCRLMTLLIMERLSWESIIDELFVKAENVPGYNNQTPTKNAHTSTRPHSKDKAQTGSMPSDMPSTFAFLFNKDKLAASTTRRNNLRTLTEISTPENPGLKDKLFKSLIEFTEKVFDPRSEKTIKVLKLCEERWITFNSAAWQDKSIREK